MYFVCFVCFVCVYDCFVIGKKMMMYVFCVLYVFVFGVLHMFCV